MAARRRFFLTFGGELCMDLRSTHGDENRFEPRHFTIELAWNGEERLADAQCRSIQQQDEHAASVRLQFALSGFTAGAGVEQAL